MITYEYDPVHNYTIQNNLGGYTGGIIGVALNDEVEESSISPVTVTANDGDRVYLKAYDDNSNPNSQEHFIFSEVGSIKSQWRSKKTTFQIEFHIQKTPRLM